MNSISESTYFITLLLSAAGAVLVFIQTQIWMNDPRRRELNEQWFLRFQDYVSSRYNDGEMRWRIRSLDGQFARAAQPDLSGPAKGSNRSSLVS